MRCAAGHEFDVARQGYVNLLSSKVSVSGDNAEMVAARAAFLDGGHYAPIMRSMVAAAQVEPAGCVADLGAGTGHYLAAVLDAGKPDDKQLRRALTRWGFNTVRRDEAKGDDQEALKWLRNHTLLFLCCVTLSRCAECWTA